MIAHSPVRKAIRAAQAAARHPWIASVSDSGKAGRLWKAMTKVSR